MNRIRPLNGSVFGEKQHHGYVLQGRTDEAKHVINNSEVDAMDSEVDVNGSEVDVIDSELPPQHSKTCTEENKNLEHFWEITYPLTISMTLFGQYFRSDHQMSSATNSARIWNKFFSYYSLSLVIVHWVNFARILTIFTKQNQFGVILFGHLQYALWYVLTASTITAMYVACKSGKLSEAMMHIGQNSGESKQFLRNQALIITSIAWVLLVTYIISDSYSFFWPGDNVDNNILTPLFTLINPPTDAVVMATKVTCYLIGCYGDANVALLVAFHLILTMTFTREFYHLNEQLKSQTERHFTSLRHKNWFADICLEHRKLIKRVEQVDYFFSGFNGAVILSYVSFVVLTIYNVCWYPIANSTFILIVSNVFWILWGLLELSVVMIGSMMVNQSVSDKQLSDFSSFISIILLSEPYSFLITYIQQIELYMPQDNFFL